MFIGLDLGIERTDRRADRWPGVAVGVEFGVDIELFGLSVPRWKGWAIVVATQAGKDKIGNLHGEHCPFISLS